MRDLTVFQGSGSGCIENERFVGLENILVNSTHRQSWPPQTPASQHHLPLLAHLPGTGLLTAVGGSRPVALVPSYRLLVSPDEFQTIPVSVRELPQDVVGDHGPQAVRNQHGYRRRRAMPQPTARSTPGAQRCRIPCRGSSQECTVQVVANERQTDGPL